MSPWAWPPPRATCPDQIAPAGSGELLALGGAGERHRGRVRCDRRADQVEVPGANLMLVLGRGVAVLLGRELGLLQLHVGRHAVVGVAAGELEHRVVERVESGERDELVLVPHLGKLALELVDGALVEVLAPVERRRAIEGEHLVRVPALMASANSRATSRSGSDVSI